MTQRIEDRPFSSTAASPACPRRVFAVVNPNSGTAAVGVIRSALSGCFAEGGTALDFHEIAEGDDLAALVRDRVHQGVDLVVVAGGDGTVSSVADALAGSGTPLGIIPMGTANVLARELRIPVDPAGAVKLLVSEHHLATIDVMKVGDRHYMTQVGVGLDALMIRDTKTEHKKRFGKLAYLWTAAARLAGMQPRQFTLIIDGKPIRTRASQLIVANVGTLGQPPFRWGPDIRLDDGHLDVFVSKARHLGHYLRIAWHVMRSKHKADPNVRYFKAERSISIDTRHPLPVQADGEIIGETPVTVEVARGAITVVVPKSTGG